MSFMCRNWISSPYSRSV